MLKFSSFVFEQKNKILFVLLFFVVIGIFIPSPHGAQAAGLFDWWCRLTPACLIGAPIGRGVWSLFGGVAVDTAVAIVKYLSLIPIYFTALLSYMAKTLLIWVFDFTESVSFTRNLAVTTGWPIVRNLANMIIVIGLIVIALATILRYKTYEAKALLAKLIIAAILINFSLVACGIVIDISNITVKYLLHIDGSPSGNVNQFYSSEILDNIVRDITGTMPADPATGPPQNATLIGKIIGVIFYQTMSAAILFLYVFLFLLRVIALWILVILSPIAFICSVFPGRPQEIWNMWQKNFFNWCIIGISGAFFFSIGEKLMRALSGAGSVGVVGGAGIPQATGAGFMQDVSLILAPIFTMLVPGFFLVLGFMFSMQTSALGANYAVSGFKKARGYLKNGAQATGKWIADRPDVTGLKARATLAYDNARQRMTRFGENTGLGAKQGTANMDQQARMAARRKPYEALASAENDNNVVAQRAMNAGSAEEKAVYTQELKKRGELQLIRAALPPTTDPGYAAAVAAEPARTAALRQAAYANTAQQGLDPGELRDSDYRYAEFDDDRVENVRAQRGLPANAAGVAAARAIVRREKFEANLPTMKAKQLRNIDVADLTPEIVDTKFTPAMIKNMAIASEDRLERLRGSSAPGSVMGSILGKLENRRNTARGNPTATPPVPRDDREVNRLTKLIDAIEALPPAP